MGAQAGSEGPTRGRSGRHRRSGQALIERRDHTEQAPARRFSLPAPSPSALVGIAVLVLIGLGVIHLSSTGSAVPVEGEPAVIVEPGPGPDPSPTEGAPPSEPAGTAAPSPVDAGDLPAEPGTAELIVHVSGAVGSPGVVRLPAGSRVDDALQAAGGPTPEADLAAVNLARPLTDGEQIHVPTPGEEPPVAAAGAGEGSAPPEPAGGAAGGERGGGPIDLNTASATELEELPGVGPAIAQRILEHRESNGPFTSVDGLLEVSGIGPATLEKIRPQATV
ncbi:helix-hairpin-helix domain-containing protein [Brachybacterium sp. UNK5269]|uniref:helix-hairpin-helix domain-containing protein n=1 Tax=Brachybacterium sp. UNK5269 TaxID=3408576 RepID=UPI003BB02BF3